jgi:hypothetical protein
MCSFDRGRDDGIRHKLAWISNSHWLRWVPGKNVSLDCMNGFVPHAPGTDKRVGWLAQFSFFNQETVMSW